MREYHPRYYCTRRYSARRSSPTRSVLARSTPSSLVPSLSRRFLFTANFRLPARLSSVPPYSPFSPPFALRTYRYRCLHHLTFPREGPSVRVSQSNRASFLSARFLLALRSSLRSAPHYLLYFSTFLLISDPPFSPFTLLPPRDSIYLSLFLFFFFSVAHLASFVRPRVFPRPFVTRSAARHDRRVTITRGPGPILRSVRPAGLRTCVSIYGKFRARTFFRSPHEFSPSRHIFVFLFFSPWGFLSRRPHLPSLLRPFQRPFLRRAYIYY